MSLRSAVSLSQSQASSLETMLSSVFEVTSWLDWWLSTCGGFREHLPDEVRGNFERLMLSGSRVLEFLGAQGVTALGNLVLSHRDSLLVDAWSTVPAEEVARLRYADLPSSPGIFPSPLLDSALTKMRAASNDALVQRTLLPPKIPWKSSAGPSKAGSWSSASADCSGFSPVDSLSQQQASTTSSTSCSHRWKKRQWTKGKAPFSGTSGGSGHSGGKRKGTGKKSTPLLRVGGLSVGALEALAVNWSEFLGVVRLAGRLPHPLPGLSSSPLSLPGIVSDVLGWVSSVPGVAPGGREDAGQGRPGNRP